MSFYFLFLALFFFVLLSLLKEFKHFDFLRARFPFLMQFIPMWSFFSPIPGMFDYYLVFRKIDKDNKSYEWIRAFNIPDKRNWYAFFWHPEKRFSKGFFDIVQSLAQFVEEVKGKQEVCLSIPYLLILNYINSLEHDQDTEKIQFMIFGSSRLYESQTIFTSEVHRLVKE